MPSTLSWLDYSEHDRRQVLDVVDLFREQDTRDELGIGAIRDAFADIFFPGTSTIQTRAKYFLFVPWIYRRLEGRRISSHEFGSRARQEEVWLINALLRSDDQDGIIGKFAQGALQRLPSAIYWQGLRRWGILLRDWSHDYYIRTVDATYQSVARNDYGDDGSGPSESKIQTWHSGIPPIPPDFPQGAHFRLTHSEAAYLRDQILTHVPRTLLSYLVDSSEQFQSTAMPWQVEISQEFPRHVQEQLLHAENFSIAIWGAALLYNLMLAEKAANDNLANDYEQLLDEWSNEVVSHADILGSWNRRRFWEIVSASGMQIPIPTRRFTDTWLDLVKEALRSRTELINLTQSRGARTLIHGRERSLKRGQARLDNQRALELWNGAAGTAQLTYRWPQARRIAFDILSGLESPDNA